jgi:uncharacterized sulfatase
MPTATFDTDGDPPNVVLCLTDSQGWNTLGFGPMASHVETPHVESLAGDGVRFDSSYCTSPVCTPSRAGLLTGRFPHTAGATANGVPLGEHVRTLGEYLRAAGYETGYVGKWHLDGTDYFGTGVPAEGYDPDRWYDGRQYLESLEPAERAWWRSAFDKRTAEHGPGELRSRGVTRAFTWAGRITDRARQFIETAPEPFCLVVSYDEPHEPSVCPPAFAERYRDEPFPVPDNYETLAELGDKPDSHRRQAAAFESGDAFIDSLSDVEHGGEIDSRPAYLGCSAFVDGEIGRVLSAAEDRDALSIFTTDHGHHLGAHGLDAKGGTMYDEVVNVPLVMRGPGIPQGAVHEGPVSHLDVLPTLLDLAGVDRPPALDGRSLRPALQNGRAHREHVVVEFDRFSRGGAGFHPIRAIVSEEYKLVVNLHDSDELYERNDAPRETTNLVGHPRHADRRDALHDALLEVMAETGDHLLCPAWKERPWREDTALTERQSSTPDRRDDGFLPPSGFELIPGRDPDPDFDDLPSA